MKAVSFAAPLNTQLFKTLVKICNYMVFVTVHVLQAKEKQYQ